MKKLDLEMIKNYWCYEEITKNHEIKIKETNDGVIISIINEYGVWGEFEVKHYSYDFDDFKKVEGYNIIENGKYNITEELEDIRDINSCIKGCLYYYHTCY